MESQAPSSQYYEGIIFNSLFFIQVSDNNNNDHVTLEYLEDNYLTKENVETNYLSNSVTSFNSDMSFSNINVNGNITSNGLTKYIFNNSKNITIGSTCATINMDKLICNDITNSGNLITTNGTSNIYVGANLLNIGSLGSTTNCNKLVCSSDITTNTGNLKTNSTNACIFNTCNNITIGSNATGSKTTINSKELIFNGGINCNTPQTTYNSGTGYISGQIVISQPFQGSSYKMVMINFNSVRTSSSWTISYTFPKAFTITPQSIINYDTNAFTVNILSVNSIQIVCSASLNIISGSCQIYGY